MLRLRIPFSFLSLGLLACNEVGVGDDDGPGGSGSTTQCTDPGVALGWTLTMPSGESYSSEETPSDAGNVPIDVSGIVSLDGAKVVVATQSSTFEIAFNDGTLPIETGITPGAAVRVTGLLNQTTYPGTPGGPDWRLQLQIENDPSGGGVDAGERLFLIAGDWATPEGSPIVVDLEDESCQVDGDGMWYQMRWLVSAVGAPPTIVQEGGTALVTVSDGPDGGAYEFLGYNATGPLEGTAFTNFLIRRAPE
jgi:hypothetical protein